MERRLAVILVADVVGYSTLMERNEAGTFARLKAHRTELFEPEIKKYHGRVFKLLGDGLLAEFGSVVDAVECAVSMQRGMTERNGSVAQDERIAVRIGINLGEVIVEGRDRHGEGVNIAARLQQLAEPGGITVSDKVAKEVDKKLALGFEPMGKHTVKNIVEPVSVFRVKLDGTFRKRSASAPRTWPWTAVLAVVLIGSALAAWDLLGLQPGIVASFLGRGPALSASEQGIPIVIVLPFQDLSGGQVQSDLGKGIAEQFITDLSTFPDFEVVSSTSSFAYAGRPIPEIVKATGARYIVEGSIRLTGERVSVTMQLINGSTDRHLRTVQFEESMTDPVTLQKAVAMRLRDELGGMTGILRKENEKMAFARTEADLTEYDYYILGHVHSLKDEGEPARAVWERGLQRFPESVLLRYKLMIYYLGFRNAVEPAQKLFDEAGALRKKSRLDEWYFHWLSARLYRRKGDHNRAVSEARATIAMSPYDALAHNDLSRVLVDAGRYDEAITWATFAMDHDPYPLPWYPDDLVDAYRHRGGQWDNVIATAEARIRADPSANRLWYKVLGKAYQFTGQSHRAQQAFQAYYSLPPAPAE